MGTLSLSGGSLALDGLWLTEARARDIEALDDLLLDGEDVLLVSSGYLMREGLPAIRRWMIVATTERLLCVRSGTFGPRRVIEISRQSIHKISTSRMLLGWQLLIVTGQGPVRIQARQDACVGLQNILANSAAPSRAPARRAVVAAPRGEGQTDTAKVEFLEGAVERLESDVARLQQQVDFLEEILRTRK